MMAWSSNAEVPEPCSSTNSCVGLWLVPVPWQMPAEVPNCGMCEPPAGLALTMAQNCFPGPVLMVDMGNWTCASSSAVTVPGFAALEAEAGTLAIQSCSAPDEVACAPWSETEILPGQGTPFATMNFCYSGSSEPITFDNVLATSAAPVVEPPLAVSAAPWVDTLPAVPAGGELGNGFIPQQGGLSSRSTAASSCPQGWPADADTAIHVQQIGKGGKSLRSLALPLRARASKEPRPAEPWRQRIMQGKPEELVLLTQLEAGGEDQLAAVSELRGSAARLALEPLGCRLVQLALQVCDQHSRASLVAEFHGHVCEMMESPHGNYVLQMVVEVMPTALVRFVALELAGRGPSTSRHRCGCRIICRLLEHTAFDGPTVDLVDEILQEVKELSRHVFGHHVIKSILEHGLPRQRVEIARLLRGDLQRLARNRNSSYVLEAVLTHCPAEGQQLVCNALFQFPDGIITLACSQFGHHLIRALVKMPGETSETTLCLLAGASQRLAASKHGRRLLEELHRNALPTT